MYIQNDEDLSTDHEEAIEKNNNLITQLYEKRRDFALIGTNKTKRRLTKISKDDPLAKAIRTALEIEDKNISAKKYFGILKRQIYQEKSELINSLITICKNNNWIYGIQGSDSMDTTHIIYFELPGCEQISWHFSPNNTKSFPRYNKKWDEKVNSTLIKLEKISFDLLRKNNLITEKELKDLERN